MDETYRMLGAERQADFAREAAKAHQAALVRGSSGRRTVRRRVLRLRRPALAGLVVRIVRPAPLADDGGDRH